MSRIYISYSGRDPEPALAKLRAALDEAGYEAIGDWVLKAG